MGRKDSKINILKLLISIKLTYKLIFNCARIYYLLQIISIIPYFEFIKNRLF